MAGDEDFERVPIGTYEQTRGSPADPGDDWRGVAIRAPQRVTIERQGQGWGPLPAIPVCGLWRLDVLDIPDPGNIELVAIEIDAGTRRHGLVSDEEPGTIVAPREKPPLPDAMYQGVFTEEYFNPDLVHTVGLPARPGRWKVQVRFGALTSNEVVIEIVEAST